MLRSTITAVCMLLAAAGGLGAQGGEVGVSLTVLEPLALAAAPRASTVRHRAREYVEVAMPLELAGRESRIVSVTGAAGAADGPAFRVLGAGGSFEPLAGGRSVSLGTSGKVGRAATAEAVYRLELEGRPAPGVLRLTVSYVVAPDA